MEDDLIDQPDMDDPPVWFVTGTSSGLGAAVARAVYRAGGKVVCAQRDLASPPIANFDTSRLMLVACDLDNPDSLQEAVQTAQRHFGRIDVLVNNAGTSIFGALEEFQMAEFRASVETNFFGPLTLIKAVLPLMRRQGKGHIVNISSIGGFIGNSGSSSYAAAKFALEGLSEALAREVAIFGIRVTIVEPGAFRTDFRRRSLNFLPRRIADYEASLGKQAANVQANAQGQRGDPDKAAAAIVAAVRSENPPQRLLLGADAWTMAQAKLEALRNDFAAWETTSRNTDFH